MQYYLSLWLADHSDRAYLSAPDVAPPYYQDQMRLHADTIRKTDFCQ